MPTTAHKLQVAGFVRAKAMLHPIETPFKDFPDVACLTMQAFGAGAELAVIERKYNEPAKSHRFVDYFGYVIEDMDWKHLGCVLGQLEEQGHRY